MKPYLVLPLLVASLSVWATPSEPTAERWQGKWGDGITDALTLTPVDNKLMKVHYWRNLQGDTKQPQVEFDSLARIEQAEPLILSWKIEGDPQQGSMRLTYPKGSESLTLHYQSAQEQGSVTMTRQEKRPSPQETSSEPLLQPHAGSTAISFTWSAPKAKAVFLAGEMNDWQADSLPMVRNDKGEWTLTLYLQPGRWAYKFVQDGMWLSDEHNPRKHSDGQGGYNSLLQVGKPDPLFVPRANPSERGTLQEISFDSRELGKRSLLLYRPAGVKADVQLPWALVLHGYGMDRQQWVKDGELPTLLDNLIAQKKIPPMALLMVDGGKSFYQGPTERFLMQDLLPNTAQWGLSENPAQRALLGVSMGGFGAFNLAYHYPEQFASSVSLSGYFAIGPQDQWQAARVAKIQQPLLYCGQQDHTSLQSNQELEQQLKKQGLELPIHYAAGGHTWHYWQSIMPEAVTKLANVISASKS